MTFGVLDEFAALDTQARLLELQSEHRDLDLAIALLMASPSGDELLVRRLKKRKLALRDRILALEKILTPDEPA